jgi:hypothetical protein
MYLYVNIFIGKVTRVTWNLLQYKDLETIQEPSKCDTVDAEQCPQNVETNLTHFSPHAAWACAIRAVSFLSDIFTAS